MRFYPERGILVCVKGADEVDFNERKDNNERYRIGSRRYNEALAHGRFDEACAILSELAAIRERENAPVDAIKLSCLQFWLRIVGARDCGCDGEAARRIRKLSADIDLSIDELRELFLSLCRDQDAPTMRMSARDCLYMLELCMDGRDNDADDIVRHSPQSRVAGLFDR